MHNADCCELKPIIYNGKEAHVIGTGGNKIAYDIGNGKVLAVMKEGKNVKELQKELDKLNQLKEMGLPTVNAKMTMYNGQPALLMDRYVKGSKDIVRFDNQSKKIVLVKNSDAAVLNEKSIRDLQRIRDKMVKDKIKIDHRLFLSTFVKFGF